MTDNMVGTDVELSSDGSKTKDNIVCRGTWRITQVLFATRIYSIVMLLSKLDTVVVVIMVL